jgi:hypothetical protein
MAGDLHGFSLDNPCLMPAHDEIINTFAEFQNIRRTPGTALQPINEKCMPFRGDPLFEQQEVQHHGDIEISDSLPMHFNKNPLVLSNDRPSQTEGACKELPVVRYQPRLASNPLDVVIVMFGLRENLQWGAQLEGADTSSSIKPALVM